MLPISRKYRLFEGIRNMKGGLKIVPEQGLWWRFQRTGVADCLLAIRKEHRIEYKIKECSLKL